MMGDRGVMRSAREQRGAVLVISLVLLVVCLMLGVSSMRLSLIDERMAGHHRASIRAQMAAETGAAAAIAEAVGAGCSEPPLALLSKNQGGLPILHDGSSVADFYQANQGGGAATKSEKNRVSYAYLFGQGELGELIIAAKGQAGSAVNLVKVVLNVSCENEGLRHTADTVAGNASVANGKAAIGAWFEAYWHY